MHPAKPAARIARMLSLLASVLIVMVIVMTAAWAFGQRSGNAGWTDVFWTFGTGAALAGAALWPIGGQAPSQRQWLVAGLVAAWSIRLGSYIAGRVAGHPEDGRYAQFRKDFGAAYPVKMLGVTLAQAPAAALLAVSVLLAARSPGTELGVRDGLAVAIALIAISGETLADAQMRNFRADPANQGKVAETGLWGWSRHPNYFFEWLIWLAYPVLALDLARPVTWLTLTASVVMLVLLTRVSGIPPLEAAMLRSRGDAYRDYQRRVSAFIPLPPKRAVRVSA